MIGQEDVALLMDKSDLRQLKENIIKIRQKTKPDHAKQSMNRPIMTRKNNTEILLGCQHKYQPTLLVFPQKGQNCFSYCTYCFRASQFYDNNESKFIEKNATNTMKYLKRHPEITDLLITGGDPSYMTYADFSQYLLPFLDPAFSHIQTIRVGTRALSYQPQRYLSYPDTEKLLKLFKQVSEAGRRIAFMAHLSHESEFSPETVQAIRKLKEAGVQIFSQTPILKHINAVVGADDQVDVEKSSQLWVRKWNIENSLGIVPYYMFIARDCGPKNYFELPLVKAYDVYIRARQQMSGLSHTLRGPSMSCTPGKIQVTGTPTINGKRVIELKFIQSRNPEWQNQPFYAQYDEKASWISQLRPAFGEKKFFYEDELLNLIQKKIDDYAELNQ